MQTHIYIHFVGSNVDEEDTSKHSANFYRFAATDPYLGFARPLPPGYQVVECCASEFPGSVDLLIESETKPDLTVIHSYIQETFGGPKQAWNNTAHKWEPIEQHTQIAVGVYEFAVAV